MSLPWKLLGGTESNRHPANLSLLLSPELPPNFGTGAPDRTVLHLFVGQRPSPEGDPGVTGWQTRIRTEITRINSTLHDQL